MLFLKTFRKQNRFLEIKNIITEMTTSIGGADNKLEVLSQKGEQNNKVRREPGH